MGNSEESIRRLKKHISALEVSYNNLVELLEEELEKEEGDNGGDKLKLKETQRKVYAEGVLKNAEAADDLYSRIKEKRIELAELKGEKNPFEKEKPPVESESEGSSALSKRLN